MDVVSSVTCGGRKAGPMRKEESRVVYDKKYTLQGSALISTYEN